MSNKPKIHAFCAAGCKWETVHMSDFLKSATFYEVGQPDGYATVDAYRKYRIFSDSNANTGKYTASIEFQSPDATGEAYETQITFSVSTGYRGYFDFEIMQARYNGAMLYIAYEVNGEELVSNINLATTEHDLTKSVLKITGANQVLIYNDTAAIVAKDGVTPIFEVDEVETLPAHQNAWVNIDNADPEHPRISFGIPRGYDGTGGDGSGGGGGSNTMTDTETGKTYTLTVTGGKLILTEVS